MNILFITPSDLSANINNGGTVVSKCNLSLLKSISYAHVKTISLTRTNIISDATDLLYLPTTRNKFESLISNLHGYSSYLSKKTEFKIIKYIRKSQFDVIFIDSSNLGRLARLVNKFNPQIKIITYFHNVESIYAKSIIITKGLHYLPMFFSNMYNERLAIKYSDHTISINIRDKELLEKKYNKKITDVISVWYDCPNDFKRSNVPVSAPIKLLFLGSYFHANIVGITWFIKKVLPFIDARLTVAGKGMEKLCEDFEDNDKLAIIGTVKNIAYTYIEADCVIAPIFDGSGMKVKTGEAFKYGKTVIGTSEAFSGYAITHGLEGFICDDKDQFIQNIHAFASSNRNKFNDYSFEYFNKFLQKNVALDTMKRILNEFKKVV